MSKIELIQGDCLEKMKEIPDKSIDMILCDLRKNSKKAHALQSCDELLKIFSFFFF